MLKCYYRFNNLHKHSRTTPEESLYTWILVQMRHYSKDPNARFGFNPFRAIGFYYWLFIYMTFMFSVTYKDLRQFACVSYCYTYTATITRALSAKSTLVA